MSYVHCPTCQRAFHLGRDRACPRCALASPAGGNPDDRTLVEPALHVLAAHRVANDHDDARPVRRLRRPRSVAPLAEPATWSAGGSKAVADIVLAATQLARALARATPTERDAARASLGLVREHIDRHARSPVLAGVLQAPLRLAAATMSIAPALASIGLVARRLLGR